MWGLSDAGSLLLFSIICCLASAEEDLRDKETFLIQYRNGENIIPVSVRLDYRQRTEYVLSLSPHSKDKTVTFYDFNKRTIAFKHLASQICFIMRMRQENINKEQRTLDSFKNEIISGTQPITLYASGDSLTAAELSAIAGEKVARFCHRTKAYTISSRRPRRRPKRQANDYSQRSYGHYGEQSNKYQHYGQETVSKGQGTPPSPPPFNPRGPDPIIPSKLRRAGLEPNGFSPGSFSFQGNQRGGYELYQPIGQNGAIRSYGEYGAGYGQVPGFNGDSRQIPDQFNLSPPLQPARPGEQVLRFPIPPSQPDDSRPGDTRGQDPRVYDPRYQQSTPAPSPYRADPRLAEQARSDPNTQRSIQSPGRTDQDIRSSDGTDTRSRDGVDTRSRDGVDTRSRDGADTRSRDGADTRSREGADTRTREERDSRSRDRLDQARYPDTPRSQHRGAASDSESGAFSGVGSDPGRRGFQTHLLFRNTTLPFDNFPSDSNLSGTGILSNTKVIVDNAGTNAVASSAGQLNEQRSQSQVQGTYAGSGSFAAQAQAGFIHGTTQSQVRGGSDGGSSISSANVERLGSAQSQVQLGTPDGKSTGSAQGNFVRGGTQAEATGSRDAGSASAQAQSPGLSSSSASVNARGETPPRERFLGEVSASSRGDPASGVSNTVLQGAYGADRTYSARAEGSFNAQDSYSPLQGLPAMATFDDRNQITSDPRRGDTPPPDYRYTTTRSPYHQDSYPPTRHSTDQGRDRTPPDYRYTTTAPSYNPYGRGENPAHTTTRSPYDQQGRDRAYRYTSTTPSPYPQSRDRSDPRRAGSSFEAGSQLYGPEARRSQFSEPSPQTKGQQTPPSASELRRQSLFPPYSPDPRLVNKGPPSPPPGYYESRRSYASPSQTKSQVSHPSPPSRSYVYPDNSNRNIFPPYSPDPRLSNKGPPSPPPGYYDNRRAYVSPSQTKSQVRSPARSYVYPDPNQPSPQPSIDQRCCRTRRGDRQPCCLLIPTADCCRNLDMRRAGQKTRRQAPPDPVKEEKNCGVTCYTVYKTIGQAKICHPSGQENC